MYIITDYRLILTKNRPDLSSEWAEPSVTALARPAATVNYRPVISSERALQNNKLANVLDGCLTPGQTGRLTVDRKLTST
jgi:hypothetical protein